MSWFKSVFDSSFKKKNQSAKASRIPEGVWAMCPGCNKTLYRPELENNFFVCPKCSHHIRIGARNRLDVLLDKDDREEIGTRIRSVDRLRFHDVRKYKERLVRAARTCKEREALIVMEGKIKGINIVACCFEFSFMGGSMGSVVGERFVLGMQRAMEHSVPFVCITASGGARMQEGTVSLMQMAKCNVVISQLKERGLPYIVVLTDPTMGGVSASLATVGDVIMAEPGALIGFAGPRVIEQTVKEKLPDGFQRSEFLLSHGMIDMIVDRREQRDTIANMLSIFIRTPLLEKD